MKLSRSTRSCGLLQWVVGLQLLHMLFMLEVEVTVYYAHLASADSRYVCDKLKTLRGRKEEEHVGTTPCSR